MNLSSYLIIGCVVCILVIFGIYFTVYCLKENNRINATDEDIVCWGVALFLIFMLLVLLVIALVVNPITEWSELINFRPIFM